LLDYIEKYLEVITNSKVEFNSMIVRPYIIGVKNSFDGEKYAGLNFKASLTWIRRLFYSVKLYWRKTTNDAGKLPDNWEEKLNNMKVRVGYLIWKLKIDLVNMDETPLMLIPSRGRTWATRGSNNVATSGPKDKRQSTGTPWLNYLGEIIFFHTTVKGKTDKCLPPKKIRDQRKFKDLLFGHSYTTGYQWRQYCISLSVPSSIVRYIR
jgi:hypothetical protein